MRRALLLAWLAASCTGQLGTPTAGDSRTEGDAATGGDNNQPGDNQPGDNNEPGDNNQPGDPGPGDPGQTGGDSFQATPTFTWTELTPSVDSHMIYVSTSGVDSGNDCLTESNPCATLMKGYGELRDGFPDWLLLKRGDQWTESFSDGWSFNWEKSGRGADEPIVLTAYGTGPRPLLKAGQEHGFHNANSTSVHDLAVVSIHFEAHTRDPYSADYVSGAGREFQSGFRWTGAGIAERFLIEDCKFEFFGSNFAMHPGSSDMFHDIKVRGNVFYSAWSDNNSEYSQGIYADGIDGLLIEGNVFDRNGGLIGFTNDPSSIVPAGLTAIDVAATWFNHQAYIQSGNRNVTVRNNIFANGDGMQLRPGGIAQDNLFTRCINSLTVGSATEPVAGGVTGAARDNVFLEGTDFAPESNTPGMRAQGINIANISSAGFVVEGNIFANDMSEGRFGLAVSANGGDCGSGNAYPCPVANLTVQNNLAFDWRGGVTFSGALGTELTGITVSGNVWHNPNPTDDRVRLVRLPGWNGAVFAFANNAYYRGGNSQWFDVGGAMDYSGWLSTSSESGSTSTAITLNDDSRSLATYNASLGGTATHDAFMAAARQQEKANWNSHYEAMNVNAWLRAGLSVP